MRATTFWKAVVVDRADLLERIIAFLTENSVRYCVVGGLAVNAYVEPVVSLDLDLAVSADDLPRLEPLLRRSFDVTRFPHSLNVSSADSKLRVQFQTDLRYADFVGRARAREVLGKELPVASLEDVLQGKLWAVQDHQRRPSKRQKDLADIARIVEAHPEQRARVPQEILDKLF
jgi:hypothetical protein